MPNPETANSADRSYEDMRIDAVRRYGILDTGRDSAFDRITAIAARRLNAPVANISIVDTDRIWFKSHHGIDLSEIPRSPGFCSSAIVQNAPWLVPDTRRDACTRGNPLVASRIGARFYLGVPLRTGDGFNLGTLHVLDTQPRTVSQGEIDDLSELASVVMDRLELEFAARRSALEREAAFRHVQLLTREIDHRVMNSLHLIASLLNLQSAHLKGTDAGLEISKAAGKIMAVAHVHQYMQEPDGDGVINCALYLDRLCAGLSQMLGAEGRLSVKATAAALPSQATGRIGLIVNELVTNAFKNGANSVQVEMAALNEGYRLSVTDDGIGLPSNFKITDASGLGLKVISSLVHALGGDVSAAANPSRSGSCFEVRFPRLKA